MAESELYYLWGEEAYRIDLEIANIIEDWHKKWARNLRSYSLTAVI